MSHSPANLVVNKERLWQSIMDMAKIGALQNGGACRTALSVEDKQGRELFIDWCQQANCEVSVDQIGNIFARRAGADATHPGVATGSHLDTQPHAGKFDGIYGVLAGLEVVRSLNDAGVTTHAPIDVIVWTNEEGVRFGPPLTGSSVFAGSVPLEVAHSSPTIDGTTVLEDLQNTGFLGKAKPGQRQLDCFVEAHIEQGPILEAQARSIGVVTHIVGIRWLEITVIGQDAHAGTTPMDRRKDALTGTAHMLVQLNQMVRGIDSFARLTTGKLNVEPNSGATIPGRVHFVCDLRHPDPAVLDQIANRIEKIVSNVADSSGLQASIQQTLNIAPLAFDAQMIKHVRDAAQALGHSHIDMLSGAGHDAMNVAKVAPTSMIFVPCAGGISHNEAESATAEDLANGTHVLLHTLLARAGRHS